MTAENPYAAPKADVGGTQSAAKQNVDGLIKGQKLVIFAILLNLGSNVMAFAMPKLAIVAMVVALVAMGMSILGVVKLAANQGMHIVITVLLCLLMLVPCLNLLILLGLNQSATSKIKAAGYKVGLLGAKT